VSLIEMALAWAEEDYHDDEFDDDWP
jgi:hypothetical protein